MVFALVVLSLFAFLNADCQAFLVSSDIGKPAADSFRDALQYSSDRLADSLIVASSDAKVVSGDMVTISENLENGLESISEIPEKWNVNVSSFDVKGAADEIKDGLQNANLAISISKDTVLAVESVTFRIVVVVGLMCGTLVLAIAIICCGVCYALRAFGRVAIQIPENVKICKEDQMKMKPMASEETKGSLNTSCQTSEFDFESYSFTNTNQIELQDLSL